MLAKQNELVESRSEELVESYRHCLAHGNNLSSLHNCTMWFEDSLESQQMKKSPMIEHILSYVLFCCVCLTLFLCWHPTANQQTAKPQVCLFAIRLLGPQPREDKDCIARLPTRDLSRSSQSKRKQSSLCASLLTLDLQLDVGESDSRQT